MSKEAYTKLLFSGISAGINVNTDRNQHASHVYIATAGLASIEKAPQTEASIPRAKKHQV